MCVGWLHTPGSPFSHPPPNCRVGSCHLSPSLTLVLFKPLICQSRKQQSISKGWNLPAKMWCRSAWGLMGRGAELFPCGGGRGLEMGWCLSSLTLSFLRVESKLQNGGRRRARSGLFAFLC
uniref:Uncharacterized protein n=1 Tax=Molossus molossus TaxID=27622 RepID=A0A7J8CZR7_MOLMO|nr:hypothetical protein HJG59_009508 [Molossus molossus]